MKKSTGLKLAGFFLLAVSITLIVLGTAVFPEADTGFPNFAIFAPGFMLIPICFFLIVTGFMPQIAKLNANLRKETLDHAGKDLGEAASQTVDVLAPSITKTVGAVKKGMGPQEQIYCKYCGTTIDADSRFCKYCSREQ